MANVKEKASPKPGKAPAKKVAAAKAEPKAKAVKVPKPPREKMPMANDVRKPKPGGKCARVWDLADQLTKDLGRTVSVAELLEAAAKDKTVQHAVANVKTEYARWRKFNGISGRVSAPKEDAPAPKAKAKAKAKAA